jgi:hypothetical protein
MDADLPTPDRVDLDPYEAEDEVIVPDDETTAADTGPPVTGPDAADDRLDLDAIEADLAGVEVALARLSDGTYWTDEATGEPLPDDLLASSPTARRA